MQSNRTATIDEPLTERPGRKKAEGIALGRKQRSQEKGKR
jgi:hypothetical protein